MSLSLTNNIVIGLVGLAVLGIIGLWPARNRATAGVVVTLTRVLRVVESVPRVSTPDRESIEHRLLRFRAAVGRLREGSPWQVGVLFGLLWLAHTLTVVALWLSFVAVGQPVSVIVLIAVIPAAVPAAIVPTGLSDCGSQ